MTDNNANRLELIEALLEKIGQRVDRNSRTIEAICTNTEEFQRSLRSRSLRDRDRLVPSND